MSLAAMGAAYGTQNSLSYLSGIIAGTFGVLILIATGVTGLILVQPTLVKAITVVAAIYILYLAYRIAGAPVVGESNTKSRPPLFYSGFILAIANPKAFAAIGAVYSSSLILPHDLMLDAFAKISALSIVIIIVNSGWLIFGSALSPMLRNPKTGRIANVIFAIMLIASVATAFLSG